MRRPFRCCVAGSLLLLLPISCLLWQCRTHTSWPQTHAGFVEFTVVTAGDKKYIKEPKLSGAEKPWHRGKYSRSLYCRLSWPVQVGPQPQLHRVAQNRFSTSPSQCMAWQRMEEKEELVSMEEVKVDIVEEEASLGSPKMERFDLEKKRAVRCQRHLQCPQWDVSPQKHVSDQTKYLEVALKEFKRNLSFEFSGRHKQFTM